MTNSSPLLSAGIDQTVKSSCEFNELISDAAAAILSHLPLLLLSLLGVTASFSIIMGVIFPFLAEFRPDELKVPRKFMLTEGVAAGAR